MVRKKVKFLKLKEKSMKEYFQLDNLPINYGLLNSRLPLTRNIDEKELRRAYFTQFDRVGSGQLNLSDALKGCRNILKLEDILGLAKPQKSYLGHSGNRGDF